MLKKAGLLMKVLIISDSHGFSSMLRDILTKENNCDMIIHLGDGGTDMFEMNDITAGKPVYQVKGNCDMSVYNFSPVIISYIDRFKFIACHGHTYNVKSDLDALFFAAKEHECNFAFFGHTHHPLYEEAEDVILFNPGSVMNGRYGILETNGDKFSLENCIADRDNNNACKYNTY